MKKQMMEKVVANKVVDLAVQTAKMPNQACSYFFGKPKENYDLACDDYVELATFMKRSQS